MISFMPYFLDTMALALAVICNQIPTHNASQRRIPHAFRLMKCRFSLLVPDGYGYIYLKKDGPVSELVKEREQRMRDSLLPSPPLLWPKMDSFKRNPSLSLCFR